MVAAPGLDVRGTGRHRVALSLDGGVPVIVDLLAGETEARWGKAVADNRRVAGATLPVTRAGRHVLHVWLVDPQVVIEGIEVAG